MWLDGLDVRLVTHFGAMIQENFKKEQQPVEKPDNHVVESIFPCPAELDQKFSFQAPPYRYPWEETNATLQALKESAGDPYDGILLEYTNPVDGGHTLPTCSCSIQLLAAQGENQVAPPHQHDGLLCFPRPRHGQSVGQ